jgi:hypothetical protein
MKKIIRQTPAVCSLILVIFGYSAIRAQIHHYDKIQDGKLRQGSPPASERGFDFGSSNSNLAVINGRWQHISPTNGIRN